MSTRRVLAVDEYMRQLQRMYGIGTRRTPRPLGHDAGAGADERRDEPRKVAR